MLKRERLERTILGEPTDRIPAALWRAFPGDDQRTADFAQAVIDFQRQYDWDFVNIYPAPNYMVIDYGVQDEWQGAPDGSRVCLKYPIKRSLDWTELRALDPLRGEFGKLLDTVKWVVEAMRVTETPVIVSVYSPLAQARRMAADGVFLHNLRKTPDRVRTGLNTLAESTLRFTDALRPLGIAGIYYIIEHADYAVFSEPEYEAIGLPYDLRILESLPAQWWLNVAYLHGASPILRYSSQYRVQALNIADLSTEATTTLRPIFPQALCGGLEVVAHLRQGTPATIRDAARNLINTMGQRRLILANGGAALTTTPFSNFRAVCAAVEMTRV